MTASGPKTLYEKIWDAHVVEPREGGLALLYVDRHLLHEVSSPQAFEQLQKEGLGVRRPETALAVADHNLPTTRRDQPIEDADSALQVQLLGEYCARFGIEYIPVISGRQGIVHVIGPEEGFTLPGLTIVCGDSHTSTHGAFGALAFGIGTSEIAHALATQTLVQKKSKTMRVTVRGSLPAGVTAKDMALAIIGRIGFDGGTGHVIEYAGPAIKALSMEGRMTLCNMSIESGARAGLIAPDKKTFAYLKGRPKAPGGSGWEAALGAWQELGSDAGARFDQEVELEAGDMQPLVTWGTNPAEALPITGRVPAPEDFQGSARQESVRRSLRYMGLEPGTPISSITVDRVFIGSCTNSRIEDLREAAAVLKGRKVAASVKEALVVPGSGRVKKQAEAEGLDRIFQEAGFSWRQPGCSMCIALNPDKVPPGERCASTSNRNFEGRQGPGARTHLMSPALAAATAVAGRITGPGGLEE